MNKKIRYSLLALILTALACRPVLAISWNEFLIVSILFVTLLGPPLYRLMRRVEEFFKHKEQKK
jgi:hypothetical protein